MQRSKPVDLDRVEEKSKNPMVHKYGITWTLYTCETCTHLFATEKSYRCGLHEGRFYPNWDACGLYIPKEKPSDPFSEDDK